MQIIEDRCKTAKNKNELHLRLRLSQMHFVRFAWEFCIQIQHGGKSQDDPAGLSQLEQKGLGAGFSQAAVIFNYPSAPFEAAAFPHPSVVSQPPPGPLSGVCNVCEIKAEEAPSQTKILQGNGIRCGTWRAGGGGWLAGSPRGGEGKGVPITYRRFKALRLKGL